MQQQFGSQRKYLYIFLFLMVTPIYWLVMVARNGPQVSVKSNPQPVEETSDYILYTPTCKIPRLPLVHPSIPKMTYVTLNCDKNGQESLVIVGKNTIQLNTELISDGVQCSYQPIIRMSDNKSMLGKAKNITEKPENLKDEFIKVTCSNEKKQTVYLDFFAFVLRKTETEDRVAKTLKHKENEDKEKFNVLMLGLDSVAKNQFSRQMLQTEAYIRQNTTFAELFGYTKIGKNTFPVILGLLGGKLTNEVEDPAKVAGDVFPLIWKQYAKEGYRTMFSEDIPWMSIFNYAKKGFKDPPTDYYLRPFSNEVEHSPVIKKGALSCWNRRLENEVILKWMEDFFDEFRGDPLFAMSFLTRITHDYYTKLSYHDIPIKNFLIRMKEKGHLNNTIVFFFSDHGFRFGNFRQTYIGRLEGKLPFIFILFPDWFPERYPQLYRNIKVNEKRLVSSLDLHATLEDILHFAGEGKNEEGDGRSISLIRKQVPAERTCKQAAIDDQFCACIQRQLVPVNNTKVVLAGKKIVAKINEMTKKSRDKCAELTLSNIVEARASLVKLGEDLSPDTSKNFLISVQVKPGGGVFESNVWYLSDNGKYSVDQVIERVNAYGNQSACIDNFTLKPFCFCKLESEASTASV